MLGREGREERLGNQERTGRRCGMTIFIGYQTALRYLRSVEDIGSLKPTKARPGTSWSIARKEIHQASAELAAFRRLIADGCPPESSARPDCRESIGERQIIGSPSDDSTALSCPGSTHDRLHFVLGSAGPGSASPNLKAMFGRRLRAGLPFFALGITWPLARPRLVSPSCPEAPMPLPSLNWAMNYAGSIASTTHQQSGFGRALLLPRWTLSKGSRGQWAWAKRRRR